MLTKNFEQIKLDENAEKLTLDDAVAYYDKLSKSGSAYAKQYLKIAGWLGELRDLKTKPKQKAA